MKFFKYCTLVVFIGLTGCDVLNQDPQTSINEDFAIRDVKSAEAALNGLYSQVQSGNYYGSNFLIISDVTSDVSESIGTWDFYREMDTYVTSAGNLENRNLWSQAYAVVNHANNIIADVPGIEDADQATVDRLLGEAYFIRGLAFFDLVRTYGGVPGVAGELGVPLVTEPSRVVDESSYPERPSIEASYAQAEEDLQNAEARLTGFEGPNFASEAAAKALLSRLYLYTGDYELSGQYATEVIENYDFELTQDYASIFIDENTPGSIFELAYNSTDGSSIRNWYFPSSEGGRGDISLHDDFVEAFQSRNGDERAEMIGFDDNVGVYYPTKYQKPGGVDNIQVLRLAEIYLNRAESRIYQNSPDLTGALEDLNRVRNRAGLQDTTGSGVDTTEEIAEALLEERNFEFFKEGHRWFDLVRTGNAVTVLDGVDRVNSDPVSLANEGRMVFPIPSRDMDANPNLEQNAAYR